jgi:hypothetical protein
MKNLTKYINLKDLVTNVAAAAIILTLIACGGNSTIMKPIIGAGARVAHLITIPTSGHRIVPLSGGKFTTAAMFQTSAPAASQVAQSYDAHCTIGTTLPAGSLIPIPGDDGTCDEFASLADATILSPGKQTFFDGTLETLIATGTTRSGAKFECRDITNTFPIVDNSVTQPMLDTTAHTVKVFNQTAPGAAIIQTPFVCNGIGSDNDPVDTIEIQFVKQ